MADVYRVTVTGEAADRLAAVLALSEALARLCRGEDSGSVRYVTSDGIAVAVSWRVERGDENDPEKKGTHP